MTDNLFFRINGLMLTAIFITFRVFWLSYLMFTTGLFCTFPGFKSYDLLSAVENATPMEVLNIRLA